MKLVAIEEHVLPGDIKHAWTTITGADDGTLALNPAVIDERLADLGEQRLALMDETGVDVQVLSLTTPGLNNLGEHGVELARRANDLLANTVRANPEAVSSFLPRCLLPMLRRRRANCAALSPHWAPEAPFCTAGSGISIWMMNCSNRRLPAQPNSTSCADPSADSATVGAKAYYTGFSPSVDLAFATFGLGWHYEAGIEFVRMVLGGVFDRHPNLQVILGHWGGGHLLPGAPDHAGSGVETAEAIP